MDAITEFVLSKVRNLPKSLPFRNFIVEDDRVYVKIGPGSCKRFLFLAALHHVKVGIRRQQQEEEQQSQQQKEGQQQSQQSSQQLSQQSLQQSLQQLEQQSEQEEEEQDEEVDDLLLFLHTYARIDQKTVTRQKFGISKTFEFSFHFSFTQLFVKLCCDVYSQNNDFSNFNSPASSTSSLPPSSSLSNSSLSAPPTDLSTMSLINNNFMNNNINYNNNNDLLTTLSNLPLRRND